jgi:peroxiredoxin
MRKAFLILLFCFCTQVFAQRNTAYNILTDSLKTIEGKTYHFSSLKENKGTIIVFLLADCPACENYALTLNRMNEKYKGSGVDVVGIFPGNYSKAEEVIHYRDVYKINFPLLHDNEKRVVKGLGARVAPGAFLIDNKGQIVYSGRIDDWMYAVGKKRTVITHHELQDAVEAVLSNRKVAVKASAPVGCLIE